MNLGSKTYFNLKQFLIKNYAVLLRHWKKISLFILFLKIKNKTLQIN